MLELTPIFLLGLLYALYSLEVRKRFVQPFQRVVEKLGKAGKDPKKLKEAMAEYRKVYPPYMLGMGLLIGGVLLGSWLAGLLDPYASDDLHFSERGCFIPDKPGLWVIRAKCPSGENTSFLRVNISEDLNWTALFKASGECPLEITTGEQVCVKAPGEITVDSGTRLYVPIGLPFLRAVVGPGPVFLLMAFVSGLGFNLLRNFLEGSMEKKGIQASGGRSDETR